MLAAIGMFVFDTQTLLPDRIGRDRAWRHARMIASSPRRPRSSSGRATTR
jgi:phage protein U